MQKKVKRYLQQWQVDLSGKRALVLGATGGIGMAVVEQLLDLGCDVVCVYRNESRRLHLQQKTEEWMGTEGAHKRCSYLFADLSDLDNVCALADAVVARGGVHFVVNCAGVYHLPYRVTASGWDVHLCVNLLSAVVLAEQLFARNAIFEKWVNTGSISCVYSRVRAEKLLQNAQCGKTRLYAATKRLLAEYGYVMQRQARNMALAHPGISATSLFASEKGGFSKAFQACVLPIMKWIFPAADMAALSIVQAVCREVPSDCWVGPRVLGVWGKPRVQKMPKRLYASAVCDVERLRTAVHAHLPPSTQTEPLQKGDA